VFSCVAHQDPAVVVSVANLFADPVRSDLCSTLCAAVCANLSKGNGEILKSELVKAASLLISRVGDDLFLLTGNVEDEPASSYELALLRVVEMIHKISGEEGVQLNMEKVWDGLSHAMTITRQRLAITATSLTEESVTADRAPAAQNVAPAEAASQSMDGAEPISVEDDHIHINIENDHVDHIEVEGEENERDEDDNNDGEEDEEEDVGDDDDEEHDDEDEDEDEDDDEGDEEEDHEEDEEEEDEDEVVSIQCAERVAR